MKLNKLPKINQRKVKVMASFGVLVLLVSLGFILFNLLKTQDSKVSVLQILNMELGKENDQLKKDLADNLVELEEIKNQDQFKINLELRQRVKDIESTYTKVVSTYEDLLELKISVKDVAELDDLFTKSLVSLAKQDYESAKKDLTDLITKIASKQQAIAASFTIPKSAPVSNTPPGSGFSSQTVQTDIGQYLVSIIAADLSSTKVIVDTASTSSCSNDCPVLSLSDYVSRNGGYAGVNGTYFCPASYPTCAGKTNSFDLLVMNKDKTYFNSDNNVYSSNPAVIFGDSYVRFVGAVSSWGRDTSPNGVLSNFPLLVSGNQNVFSGDDDPKKGSKAGRSFVANKGSSVFIGVVHNSTVAEAGKVLSVMGMENALNLDSGGSTALWSSGYKVGPGRNIPNAIVFIKK